MYNFILRLIYIIFISFIFKFGTIVNKKLTNILFLKSFAAKNFNKVN